MLLRLPASDPIEQASSLDLLELGAKNSDALLAVLELLDGADLCSCACACTSLTAVVHEDALWLPLSAKLPSTWRYTADTRTKEACWAFTLRIRQGLYMQSAAKWKKLADHRKGCFPYLAELGSVMHGSFCPDTSRLEVHGHKHGAICLKYGFICELVQLEAAREGGLSHRTYKAVAEEIAALSTDARTAVPEDLHMVIREIYKQCYAGFGSAPGTTSAATGFGESGTLAHVIARKGVARRVSKESIGTVRRVSKESMAGSSRGGESSPMGGSDRATDEDMRKRLERQHDFMSLMCR